MATVTTFEQSINKANALPKTYQDALAAIIDQLYNLALSDKNTHPKKQIGIADGECRLPEDINVYDEEISQMFGITE